MRRWLLVAACGLTFTGTVDAQPSDVSASAEVLFSEGRSLAAAGQHAEACVKFEASLRLEEAIGTRLNLGDCYEATGKLATAWSMYRAAADAARLRRDPRESLATTRAERVRPRLPRLLVRVAKRIPHLSITRGEAPVDPAMFDHEQYVDLGPTRIIVTAPGHVPFEITVDPREGALVEVDVPPLAVAPTVTAPATIRPQREPHITPPRPPPRRPARRPLAIGLAIGGGAALVTGAVFGWRARGAWNEAFDDGHCDRTTRACTAEGQALTDDARRDATISSMAVGAGLVSTGLATYYFLRDRGQPERTHTALTTWWTGDGAGLAWTAPL